MAVIISCPSCGNQGELPDGGLGQVTLTCRNCGVKFSPFAETPTPAVGGPVVESSAVWIGPGAGPVAVVPAPKPVVTREPAAAASLTLSDLTPETAAAHLGWLRAETQRFQVYVERQLAALQKMREQVAAYEAKARADTVLREQVLGRERAVVEARTADISRREAELAAALNRRGEELAVELERQVATERGHLERRADELARLEQSLQQRLFEVEELEQTLRSELDEREVAVERQRREVEEAAHDLRTRTPPVGPRPAAVLPPQAPAFPCG